MSAGVRYISQRTSSRNWQLQTLQRLSDPCSNIDVSSLVGEKSSPTKDHESNHPPLPMFSAVPRQVDRSLKQRTGHATPSDDAPSNRTVGSAKLWPWPPSQDSKVSTPLAISVMTISRMPSSSGGSNLSSWTRCKFAGSGLKGVLPGQCSQRCTHTLSTAQGSAFSGLCPVTAWQSWRNHAYVSNAQS